MAADNDRNPGNREAIDVGDVKLLTAADLLPKATARLRDLIDKPKGKDRSRDAFACAGEMVRRGYSDEAIVGVLLNPANAVSEHCLSQAGKEQRAAERCIERVRGDLRDQASGKSANDKIGLQDFYAYMPMHSFIFVPARDPWPAASVNARIPPVPVLDDQGNPKLDKNGEPETISASMWLDQNRPVEQMTWAPGEPIHVVDRLVSEGGWIHRPGTSCFNQYLPPMIGAGDARQARRWVEHVHHVYPDDAEHIIKWLAQRVQHPEVKINHALVFGGNQGIGKDTLLEPVKYAIGPWNFAEVSPQQLLGRFNGFLKSVILRVSEARDLGDVDRFAFYDHTKAMAAAPPDVLRVDEKHLREYAIFNVTGMIITSNHKTDGIYLPADDRRHYVAWSNRTREEYSADYWTALYGWLNSGGNQHVAAYLAGLDLSRFDPKAPPKKTAAFWEIADSNRAPEDAELADALDKLMNPKVLTIAQIASNSDSAFCDWLTARANTRKVSHRLTECGYIRVRNPDADDGLWRINNRRVVVYGQRTLSTRDSIEAAQNLASFHAGRR